MLVVLTKKGGLDSDLQWTTLLINLISLTQSSIIAVIQLTNYSSIIYYNLKMKIVVFAAATLAAVTLNSSAHAIVLMEQQQQQSSLAQTFTQSSQDVAIDEDLFDNLN